jgi:hypothetical protein
MIVIIAPIKAAQPPSKPRTHRNPRGYLDELAPLPSPGKRFAPEGGGSAALTPAPLLFLQGICKQDSPPLPP